MRFWLLLAAAVVAAQGSNYDARKDFCRRFYHASAVVDDRLYIDGGQLNLVGKGGMNYTNNKLLYHDLTSTKWNGSDELGLPPLYANLSKPSNVPSLVGGMLWPDATNGYMYQYGGAPISSSQNLPHELWQYDVWEDVWAKRDLNPNQLDIQRLSFGAGTTVEHLAIGYYLGGWIPSQSERTMSNKLLTYNMVTNEYTNITGPLDGIGRAEGLLVYVHAGDNGLLVYMGGVRTRSNEAEAHATVMTYIDIYDIGNQKWYLQNATGSPLPPQRRRFCGGVVSAEDNSSHNIYIYGGLGFDKQHSDITGFDDVWVFSLPSFRWIQVYPRESSSTNLTNGAAPHYGMTCNVVSDAQMLVIGGIFPKDMDANQCDAQGGAGVHNFNFAKTDDYYWQSYQPGLKGYKISADITSEIGGGPMGGATLTKPTEGWGANSDLKELFSRTPKVTPRKPVRKRKETKKEDNKVKKIVVPVVVVVTGILVALGFCFFRRYRRSKNQKVEEAAGTKAAGTEASWPYNRPELPAETGAAMSGGYGYYKAPGGGDHEQPNTMPPPPDPVELPEGNMHTPPAELAGVSQEPVEKSSSVRGADREEPVQSGGSGQQ